MTLEPWKVEIKEKTLWDEYAMAALQGLLATGHYRIATEEATCSAIIIADDMMENRKRYKK